MLTALIVTIVTQTIIIRIDILTTNIHIPLTLFRFDSNEYFQ